MLRSSCVLWCQTTKALGMMGASTSTGSEKVSRAQVLEWNQCQKERTMPILGFWVVVTAGSSPWPQRSKQQKLWYLTCIQDFYQNERSENCPLLVVSFTQVSQNQILSHISKHMFEELLNLNFFGIITQYCPFTRLRYAMWMAFRKVRKTKAFPFRPVVMYRTWKNQSSFPGAKPSKRFSKKATQRPSFNQCKLHCK